MSLRSVRAAANLLRPLLEQSNIPDSYTIAEVWREIRETLCPYGVSSKELTKLLVRTMQILHAGGRLNNFMPRLTDMLEQLGGQVLDLVPYGSNTVYLNVRTHVVV